MCKREKKAEQTKRNYYFLVIFYTPELLSLVSSDVIEYFSAFSTNLKYKMETSEVSINSCHDKR